MIRLIQMKYNNALSTEKLMFEANGIISAIAPDSVAIGTLNQGRLDYMQKMLHRHDLLDPDDSLGQSLYRDASGIRQKILSHISFDQIVYVSLFILLLLIVMLYLVRKLQTKKRELIVLKEYAEDFARVKIGVIRTVNRNMSGRCIGTDPDSISVDIRTLESTDRYVRTA